MSSSANLCSICLAIIFPETPHINTRCNHEFHKDCIDKWLLIKETCPYCRKSLKYINQFNGNRLVAQVDLYNQMSIILSDTKVKLKISKLKYNLDDFGSSIIDNIEYPELEAYKVIRCNTDVYTSDIHSRGYRLVESVLQKPNSSQYWIHIEPLSEHLNKFIIIKETRVRPGLYFIDDIFERMWSHEVRVETAEI